MWGLTDLILHDTRLHLPNAGPPEASLTGPSRARRCSPDRRGHGSAVEGEVLRIRARPPLPCLDRPFELAGVEFIDENGGGPGVRLREWQRKKG